MKTKLGYYVVWYCTQGDNLAILYMHLYSFTRLRAACMLLCRASRLPRTCSAARRGTREGGGRGRLRLVARSTLDTELPMPKYRRRTRWQVLLTAYGCHYPFISFK